MHPKRQRFMTGALSVALLLAMLVGCKPRKESVGVKESASPQASAIVREPDDATAKALSAARLELANAQLLAGSADRALLFAISALEADPKSSAARRQLVGILGWYGWALPELRFQHGQRVDHLEFRSPATLWVASSGDWNALSRWNVSAPAIEAVLFPRKVEASRSVNIAPDGGMLVVEREGHALLCDAQSLKPVQSLGCIPENMTPSSAIVFSADGLLLAHPAIVDGDPKKLVWHLRDARSGEIVRSSDVMEVSSRRALAAFIDRTELRVLHSDASLWVMPVSTVEACRWEPAADAIELKHASYEPNGSLARVLVDNGPHAEPELSMLPKVPESPDVWDLLASHPWSRQASVWSSLYRHEDELLKVDDKLVLLGTSSPVLLRDASAITALHRTDHQLIVANESGQITFYRIAVLPTRAQEADAAWVADAAFFASIKHLVKALTGLSLDADGLSVIDHGPEDRVKALGGCDFVVLGRGLAEIDFTAWRESMGEWNFKASDAAAAVMLGSRIAEADPERAGEMKEVEDIFAAGEIARIVEAISGPGSQGAMAAKQLQLALASTQAELIDACLRRHPSMPATLQRLAHSRMAWLQGRKADAIVSWPEPFPDYGVLRRNEDWRGWEQVDFSAAFNALRDDIKAEIDSLKLSVVATDEQLKELAQRFENPDTMRALGRARYAKACIDAAPGFCKSKDHAQIALQLATRARNLGHPPEPCLRAEALAFTVLEDFPKAHDRWLMLISEFPQSTHESGDYAEAAYTAFELGDVRQAMEILITGLHRFPQDADFALRAGWIALLTDHADRAYSFLLGGSRVGYDPQKIGNATALLAIAAKLSGSNDDAAAHYAQLVQADGSWRDANTIEALDWPDDFKSALESLRSNSALVRPTR